MLFIRQCGVDLAGFKFKKIIQACSFELVLVITLTLERVANSALYIPTGTCE